MIETEHPANNYDMGRQFLTRQVERARSQFEEAMERLVEAQKAIVAAREEHDAMQKALVLYTRNRPDPYQPEPLPPPTMSEVNALFVEHPRQWRFRVDQPELRVPTVRKVKELDTSPNSKAGVLRGLIRDFQGEMTIESLFAAIPEDNPLKIEKGDLYRMLPRFVGRGELVKIGRVYYRPGEEPKTQEDTI